MNQFSFFVVVASFDKCRALYNKNASPNSSSELFSENSFKFTFFHRETHLT